MIGQGLQSELFSAGRTPSGASMTVASPFNGDRLGAVVTAAGDDIDAVLDRAADAAGSMRKLSGYQRAELLIEAAARCDANSDRLAELVVAEQGKTIREATGEASRLGALLRYCAGEAQRITGEVLPLDGTPAGEGRFGYTIKQPAGVVVAITPFNYPLLLVAHKVAPALAAGNAVIVKPSSYTPLSAFAFLTAFLEAGFPLGSVQCVVGSGSDLGPQLVSDRRVRVVTFTGSAAVGEAIVSSAGVKRTLMELGANCPVVVLDDADVAMAAEAIGRNGMVNCGQVCISPQRVIVSHGVYEPFLDALVDSVSAIKFGDPTNADMDMGTMISPDEAARVAATIEDAVANGARIVTGGGRDGAVHEPTIVADAPSGSRILTEELFGPALTVATARDVETAIEMCNDTSYGLGAGIFTNDIGAAMRFTNEVDAGLLHVNWSPLWRVDPMPYGGLKNSGVGKEGPHYAIEEMMDTKTVVIHPSGQQ